jgi:hypothetical protein
MVPRRRNCERPLAVAPKMPNLDPWVSPCFDPSPRSSTGVGILGDAINYRGQTYPSQTPFNCPCDFIPITIARCIKAIYHPSVDPRGR